MLIRIIVCKKHLLIYYFHYIYILKALAWISKAYI